MFVSALKLKTHLIFEPQKKIPSFATDRAGPSLRSPSGRGPQNFRKEPGSRGKKKKFWFQMNYKNNLAHPFNQKTKILVDPTKHWF